MATEEKLLVIGVAGLSLDRLEAALANRLLPHFCEIVGDGLLTPLFSPVPSRSAAAWATLSSGVTPMVHGIVTDDQPWQGGLQPVGRASWRVAPVWTRLERAGIATASVCWPTIHPGAAWDGLHIDARYAQSSGRTRLDWPLPLDVAPPEHREALRELRVHASELRPEMVMPLTGKGSSRAVLAELARLASVQAAVGWLLARRDRDCCFVHFDWLERIAVALDLAEGQTLPASAWLLLDAAIALTVAAVPATTGLMLLSPGDKGPGVVLRRGNGFAAGTRQAGSSTLDIAVAIQRHFACDDSGFADALVPSAGADPARAGRDAARLATFGMAPVVSPPAFEQRRALAEAELALATDPARTVALADAVIAASGDQLLPLGLIAAAHVSCEQFAQLPELADRIGAVAPGHAWEDLIRGVWHARRRDGAAARRHLERAERDAAPDVQARAGAAWLMLGMTQDAARCFRAVLAISPSNIAGLRGMLATGTLAPAQAVPLLRRLLAIEPGSVADQAMLERLGGQGLSE